MLVNMTEGSPIVPTESHILGIPIFSHSSSPSMPQPPSRSLQRLFLYSYNQQSTDSKQTDICQCPHVLVSDDDPFQTFFYETMFQRSISWEEILGEEENFRFELFLSGEDLIKRYNRIKGCNCGRPILIITDYNMGDKRLNGLDTIKTLKNLGFQGAIVLRTSEEKEDLIKRHSDLAEMLESKTIDHYVEKNNFKKVKEVIQALVKDLND